MDGGSRDQRGLHGNLPTGTGGTDPNDTRPVLRLTVLAGYTADPLVPNLTARLDELGLAADVTVGPFDQIVQQCLDDGSDVARSAPDVLVVTPRALNAWDHSRSSEEDAGARDHLLDVAEAALSAGERWNLRVVFVLPPLPQHRPLGVGDAGDPAGVVLRATAEREAARAMLAGRPLVGVVDAEDDVRELGAQRAYDDALDRLAKVPYTDELFARLGHRVAALLGVTYGPVVRTAVVDLGSLLGPDELSRGEPPAAELVGLRGVLTALAGCGIRVEAVGRVEGRLPLTLRGALHGMHDHGDVEAVAVEAVARGGGIAREVAVIRRRGDGALPLGPSIGAAGVALRQVHLAPGADSWAGQLQEAGVLDRLPLPAHTTGQGDGARTYRPSGEWGAPLTLADYVESLQVRVSCRDVDPSDASTRAILEEVVSRAHDFTLGTPPPPAPRWTAVSVRDRTRDHGVAAAVAHHVEGDALTVQVFSVSCPVLGRGVEDAVLGRVVDVAAALGCARVVLRYAATGSNGPALEFVGRVAGTARVSGDRHVAVEAVQSISYEI